MKVIEVETGSDQFSIGMVGDIQLGNPGFSEGAWSRAVRATRQVQGTLFLVGMGDYIDFMSPSNRANYRASGIYSSSRRLIDERVAVPLVKDVAAKMKGMNGKWSVLLEGHHWCDMYQAEADGSSENTGATQNSDIFLAQLLDAPFVGLMQTALVRFKLSNGRVFTLLASHGAGGGQTLTYMLNKMVKKVGGWEEIDAVATGHTHVLSGLAIPKLRYSEVEKDLVARNVPIINTGSFLKGIKIGAALYPEFQHLAGEERAMGMPILHVECKDAGKRDFGVSLTLNW